MTDPADCLFCKIVAGEVPSETVYEPPNTVAFKDITPAAPLHVLVVPRRHIVDASTVTDEDGHERGIVTLELLGHALKGGGL